MNKKSFDNHSSVVMNLNEKKIERTRAIKDDDMEEILEFCFASLSFDWPLAIE